MASISQSLEQKLQQRLSPQQIQGIKLLELPTLQLEQRVKQEIEENPVLEEEEHETDPDETGLTLEDYIRNEENASSYKLKVNNASKDDERRSPTLSQGLSLQDFLLEQLSYHHLSDREMTIARFVIGTLDDDGYLRRPTASIADDLAFTQGLEVPSETGTRRHCAVIFGVSAHAISANASSSSCGPSATRAPP